MSLNHLLIILAGEAWHVDLVSSVAVIGTARISVVAVNFSADV